MGDDFENCELEICWQDGKSEKFLWDRIPMINNYETTNYEVEINGLNYIKEEDFSATLALEYDKIFEWIFCSRIGTCKKALLKSNKRVKLVLKRNRRNED